MNQVALGHEYRRVKTEKMLELEQQYNQPIDELVIDTFNRCGTKGTCDFLGITPATLRSWCKALEIVRFRGAAKKSTLKALRLKVWLKQDPDES